MPQKIMRTYCAVIRPDHFKFASYGPAVSVEAHSEQQEAVNSACAKFQVFNCIHAFFTTLHCEQINYR